MRESLTRAVYALAFTAALVAGPVAGRAEEPSLKFHVSGELVKEWTLTELKAKLKAERVQYHDPFAAKTKRYDAFPLAGLMTLAFGEKWTGEEYTEVAFKALDGYEAVSTVAKLREPGGYLAFRDADVPTWEPIGKRKANPGPFYLLWTGPDQTTAKEYPWPWQIAAISLMRFEDQYPAVVPKNAAKDSPAWRGYEIFKGQCVRCHAMDQQGGKIGPDLNAPQSIVEYRSKRMIMEFIKNPSKYRHTYMPDHEHLTHRNLTDLYRYFQAKSDEKD